MGPTAAGKTALAVELIKQLPVEIISVDSAMVYRGMDIGTGKPTPSELAISPHHLINIRDPSEPYSAAEFAQDAGRLISEIHNKNKIPLLVGGTFLYFRALQHGLSPLPSADANVRAHLMEEGNQVGWASMHTRLQSIDPISALRIHPNDPQRIQRALEVYEISGRTMSSFFTEEKNSSEYQIRAFAVAPLDRQELHSRIESRWMGMLEAGLVAEVEQLYHRGDLTPDVPSIRSVGYRQVWKYLEGDCNYDEMVYKAIVATRQLAKRQLTWLRSLHNINWLQNNHLASLKTVVDCVS